MILFGSQFSSIYIQFWFKYFNIDFLISSIEVIYELSINNFMCYFLFSLFTIYSVYINIF